MKRIIIGDCKQGQQFDMLDPDIVSEQEFEHCLATILPCFYQDYTVFVFGGSFQYDTQARRPDLAMVAKDFSHWFIIEVELVTHSLDKHVLPQVKAFRYGQPQSDCISILRRELNVSATQAETLLHHVPRGVAVIANKPEPKWDVVLRAHDIQMLSAIRYSTPNGPTAVALSGSLEVSIESMGFGKYSSVDKAMRFPRTLRASPGKLQIADPEGATAIWTVTFDSTGAWITRDEGTPNIPDGMLVQLIRNYGDRITMRMPNV